MKDAELPVIVVLEQPGGESQKAATALGAVMMSAFDRAANAASLAPLVAEDLLRHLHLKLHHCYQAQRRSASFLGNLHNLLTGGDPNYIEMGGSHLRQTLALMHVEDEGSIDGYGAYLLRFDVARQAHDLLGTQLDVAPDRLQQGLD